MTESQLLILLKQKRIRDQCICLERMEEELAKIHVRDYTQLQIIHAKANDILGALKGDPDEGKVYELCHRVLQGVKLKL